MSQSHLDSCCLSLGSRIIDAMRAIDSGAIGAAFVVSEDRRLLGVVTDGNLRRAILGGASLESPVDPVINRQFIAVDRKVGRAEVLDLMQARSINQIPILDDDGRLVGLHLLREMFGAVERPNWAVIMAGGRGQRLHPLTESLPKPMLKIAGRPILERIILHLVGFGIRRIFISINYLGHLIEQHFGDGKNLGCHIEYLKEDTPLGTGGALSLLPTPPDHPVLVINGDIVSEFNLDNMLTFHDAGNHFATIGARRYFHQIPFGVLGCSDSRLQRLDEKPVIDRLINCGIYILSPELLRNLPPGAFHITQLFEEALSKQKSIGVFNIQEPWLDVGRFDQLREAREGS